MAYKVIILYQLYMPSYFLGTFTEYPYNIPKIKKQRIKVLLFQEKVSFLSQENQDHKGQIA